MVVPKFSFCSLNESFKWIGLDAPFIQVIRQCVQVPLSVVDDVGEVTVGENRQVVGKSEDVCFVMVCAGDVLSVSDVQSGREYTPLRDVSLLYLIRVCLL